MPKIPALPFVRSGVSAGLSANQAYRDYQQAAQQASFETGDVYTASNRSAFLQLYSSTRSVRANVQEAMNAPKTEPAGGLPIPERESVRATGYGQWAVVFSRPIGSSEVERLFYFQRSNEPLTPEEVEQRARADFEASAVDEHGSMYRNIIEGVAYTGTEKLTPTQGL